MQHVVRRPLLFGVVVSQTFGRTESYEESKYMHTGNAITTTPVLLRTNRLQVQLDASAQHSLKFLWLKKNCGFYFRTDNRYPKDIGTIQPETGKLS